MSVEFTAWRDAVVKKLRRVISLAESIGDGEPENHHTLFTRQFIAVEIKDLGELVSAVPGCLEFDAMVGFLRLDEFCKRLQIDRNPETGGYSFPREALNLFVGELSSPVGLTSLKKIALLLERAETGNDTGEPANGTGPTGPPVTLGKSGDEPIVRGKRKGRLTLPRHNVVEALLAASDDGLSKDSLATESGHSDAVNILKRLAESDPDWKAVIKLAGRPGGRYRISD